MVEEKKNDFDTNSDSFSTLIDESLFLTSAVDKPLLESVVGYTSETLSTAYNKPKINSAPCCCHFKYQSSLPDPTLLISKVGIVQQEQHSNNSVTHRCLILPTQIPNNVTIPAHRLCLIDSEVYYNSLYRSIDRYKKWFHQYLTFWFFLFISLVQLSITLYSYKEPHVETVLSYIVQRSTENGLQADGLRIYPCGHPTPPG